MHNKKLFYLEHVLQDLAVGICRVRLFSHIESSICTGFPIAMFDHRRVEITTWHLEFAIKTAMWSGTQFAGSNLVVGMWSVVLSNAFFLSNGGCLKWSYFQIIHISVGFPTNIYKASILRYPHFTKPPNPRILGNSAQFSG